MNDFTGMDWGFFFYTLGSLIYAALPFIVIMAGIGLIIGSVNNEPWGTSIYIPGIVLGFLISFLGIFWGVSR
jgi:hypothetical protein